MLTVFAVIGIVILLLAIAGTFAGMAKGDTFSLVMWVFYAGEWFKMLAELIAFVGKGIASVASND